VTTPDTSIVIAAFARWHERHGAAQEALAESKALIGHVAVESYSVLTRLPPPRRASAAVVVEFLEHHFPQRLLSLDGRGYARLLRLVRDGGVTGGAVYDALVAVTAAHADATLVTLDASATRTYAAAGVEYRLLK
jgi:predicted nucleic acid-binding protein